MDMWELFIMVINLKNVVNYYPSGENSSFS
jgi:hypothetical protein